MAIRNLIHINHLEKLKKHLVENGWTLHEPKGDYEVLRATNKNRKYPLILYKKLEFKQHLTCLDRDFDELRKFIKTIKRQAINHESDGE